MFAMEKSIKSSVQEVYNREIYLDCFVWNESGKLTLDWFAFEIGVKLPFPQWNKEYMTRFNEFSPEELVNSCKIHLVKPELELDLKGNCFLVLFV